MKKYYLPFVVLIFLFIFSYVLPPKMFKKDYPSVLNFGDVMFDRGVRNIIENRHRDPFEYVKKNLSLLKPYDVIIANLEGPIIVTDRSFCQTKEYNFQFAPYATDYLKSIGIGIVNIANNHNLDCYRKGFESTKKYLTDAGIDYVGDSNPEKSYVIKNIDEKKIAFIGMDQTIQTIPISSLYPIVKKLKAENDYVVVDIHWGTEYLKTSDENQQIIAHKLIDSGADVIFGHHPHVVEPMEVYKGKAIFYSLGNFVFDQNFGDTTIGLGVGVEFQEKNNVFNLFPYNMKTFAPDFMKGEEKEKFCDKFLAGVSHNSCQFNL